MAATGLIETDWSTPSAASDHQHMVFVCARVLFVFITPFTQSNTHTHAHRYTDTHITATRESGFVVRLADET